MWTTRKNPVGRSLTQLPYGMRAPFVAGVGAFVSAARPSLPRPGGDFDEGGGMLGSVAEMRLFDLRVTVERIEGRSVCGLEVGDYFELTEDRKSTRLNSSHTVISYAVFCLK